MSKMAEISPKPKNLLKPLKLENYQNTPETKKLTEIPRKLENDQNTPKTYKMTKIPPKIYKMTKMPLKPVK